MKPEAADSTSGQPDDLDWARHAGATGEILAGLDRRARRRRVRNLTLGSALAVALACGAGWQMRPTLETISPTQAVVASTLAVIQPASQTLPDGSVVELREGAEITVNYTADSRRVALVRGAAHFAVAKNPDRPFVVSARGVDVRAVGTAFAVDSNVQAVEVIVTEGSVAVETFSAPGDHANTERTVLAAITAGHRTVIQFPSITADVETLGGEELSARLAWRIPRIEFSKSTLAQLVAEVNKHNRTQLVLGDDSISRLQISGTLRADRLDALAELLAADFGIRAERSGDRVVLRPSR